MRKSFTIVFTALLGLALFVGGMTDADARRLGGGASFGGKSAFNSPYKRQTAAPMRTAKQQQATQHNQATKQSWARRGGFMGMLGGLAIGGLLGSLLFGGAFENINFMDILMFGGIAFMLSRLLRARAGASALRPAYDPNATPSRLGESTPPTFETPQRFVSRDVGAKAWFRGDEASTTPSSQPLELEGVTALPEGFDEAAFLAGAQIAFRDLQKAWDDQDLVALKSLTTDSMLSEIQGQLTSLDADNRTDVLKLNAELLDAREVEGMLEAVVLFDAIMREDSAAQARQVREVWHFTKPVNSQQPKWYLDGIQQLEE